MDALSDWVFSEGRNMKKAVGAGKHGYGNRTRKQSSSHLGPESLSCGSVLGAPAEVRGRSVIDLPNESRRHNQRGLTESDR